MSSKPNISARETIVIDEKEISQLDEISLTSVVRQLTDTSEPIRSVRDNRSQDSPTTPIPSTSQSPDATINELLDDPAPTAASLDNPNGLSAHDPSLTAELAEEAVDELLSADILFPDGVED